MKKINRSDWFKHGMEILTSDGFSKITINNLCFALKVTKGSFYHHFGNIDGYVKALMEYWIKTNTLDFIEESNKIVDLTYRRNHLRLRSMHADYGSEQAIRAWSYSHPIVKKYVQEADQIRLSYLIGLKIEMGIDPEIAQRSAMLQLATLVGIQQLYPNLSKEELDKMYFR